MLLSFCRGQVAWAIINSNSNTLVSGTSKNDHISNWGDNVTISSGAGNDRVVNGGNNVTR